MLLSMVSTFAQGESIESFTWYRNGDTLIISGIGAMPDFDRPHGGPWNETDGNGGYWCTFRHVIIENGLTSIGRSAFHSSTMMKSISISNSVTRIEETAFTHSGLQTVDLPSSITTIVRAAFAECYSLNSIILPNSITNIEEYAFYGCRLVSITNLNSIPLAINSNVFDEMNINTVTLYVPKNSVSLYKNAPVWRGFNIVGIEVGIEEIETKSGSGDQLLVYPNPATGACSITMPEEFLDDWFLTLSVYDASGKLIQQMQIDNDDPEKVSLRLDHKAQGVYVVTLSNGVRSFSGKVVFN